MASMLEHDAGYQKWLGQSKFLRILARYFALPFYYHLVTSGYGAFVNEELVGWLYIRGWKQMLYIETLATKPAWRKQGIARALLAFAERQARELHRQWMGLTVTGKNEAALHLYEGQGYQRAHWRVMHLNGRRKFKSEDGRRVYLRPIFGPLAYQAYCHFSASDLAAGDGWTVPVLAQQLQHDPHHWPGREWLVSIGDQPVAYLNRHGSRICPNLYLACEPDWWGNPHVLEAVEAVLSRDADQMKTVILRLGSSGHHDAALPLLTEMGFTTHPTILFRMFKHLGD